MKLRWLLPVSRRRHERQVDFLEQRIRILDKALANSVRDWQAACDELDRARSYARQAQNARDRYEADRRRNGGGPTLPAGREPLSTGDYFHSPAFLVRNAVVRRRQDGKPGVEIDVRGEGASTGFEGCIFNRAGMTDGQTTYASGSPQLVEVVPEDWEPRTDAPLVIRANRRMDTDGVKFAPEPDNQAANAVGDGVADDTAAIQAAVDASSADRQDRLDRLCSDVEQGRYPAKVDLLDLVRVAQAVRRFHEREALEGVARLLREA